MKQDQKIIIGIVIASLAILLGGLIFLSKIPSSNPNNIQGVDTNLLIREDSLKVSTSSAQLTIVEFSDYNCPACAIADKSIRQLLVEFSGKINFAFRHFPLPQHKTATLAAFASEAAGEQGKFLEMSSKLFETQEEWGKSDNPLEYFIKYAQELNLDTEKFKEAVESKKFADKITRDTQDALSLKVNSTPTFYINNQKYEGGLSFDDIKTKVEEVLAE